MTAAHTEVSVGGKRISLSNLDKVLYPRAGFNKMQVIDYYTHVAPSLLPHLKNRPLTLKRYPNGVTAEFFYEKRCPSFRPPWLKTVSVYSKTNNGQMSFCVVNDLPSLLWIANLATLELHTSLAKAPSLDRPTMMVFDLDPGPGTDILDCAEVAFQLRPLLAKSGLASFPKTSGSKGLQIYVPLNTTVAFERTKEFARALAEKLAREHPNSIVANMSKALRKGKVFIDWSQNDRHKTTVCVYSLRAKDYPTVSTPVEWGEVERALETRSPKSLSFDASAVIERVKSRGDLFATVLKLKQKLPVFED